MPTPAGTCALRVNADKRALHNSSTDAAPGDWISSAYCTIEHDRPLEPPARSEAIERRFSAEVDGSSGHHRQMVMPARGVISSPDYFVRRPQP